MQTTNPVQLSRRDLISVLYEYFLTNKSSLTDFEEQISTEKLAKRFLEKLVWPKYPICPYCNTVKKVHSSGGEYKCLNKKCNNTYSVISRTTFDISYNNEKNISLQQWMVAVFMECNSGKELHQSELSKQIAVDEKQAWYMLSLIRNELSPFPNIKYPERPETKSRPFIIWVKNTTDSVQKIKLFGNTYKRPKHKEGVIIFSGIPNVNYDEVVAQLTAYPVTIGYTYVYISEGDPKKVFSYLSPAILVYKDADGTTYRDPIHIDIEPHQYQSSCAEKIEEYNINGKTILKFKLPPQSMVKLQFYPVVDIKANRDLNKTNELKNLRLEDSLSGSNLKSIIESTRFLLHLTREENKVLMDKNKEVVNANKELGQQIERLRKNKRVKK